MPIFTVELEELEGLTQVLKRRLLCCEYPCNYFMFHAVFFRPTYYTSSLDSLKGKKCSSIENLSVRFVLRSVRRNDFVRE